MYVFDCEYVYEFFFFKQKTAYEIQNELRDRETRSMAHARRPSRRHQKKGDRDQGREGNVRSREYPRREVVENQAMCPVADEIAWIVCVAGAHAHPVFERRQRAHHADD